MKIETLRQLFADLIFDIKDAENRLVKALPKCVEAASDSNLADAFQTHLGETRGQIERIEKVENILNLEEASENCEAMTGLVKEVDEFIKKMERGPLLDAALIAAAQKVEHYEIAAYGALCSLAQTLGYDEVSSILHETLEEEKDADQKLSMIAEQSVNEHALSEVA